MKNMTKNRVGAKKALATVMAGALFAATSATSVPVGAFARADRAGETAKNAVSVTDGLQIWYDTSDLKLVTGERIAKLDNKAPSPTLPGVGNAVQSAAANQPSYIAKSDINGLPAIRLDANTFMRVGGANGFFLDDMTIVAVGNFKYDGRGTREILSRLHGAPFNHNWYFDLENGFNFGWGSKNGNAVTHNQARVPFVSGTPAVFVGRKSGTTGTSMVNGAVMAEFSGMSPSNTSDPVYLGGVGNSADCDIGEIMVFDRGLSDEELRSVNSYLFEKWSFESTDGNTLDGIYYDGKPIDGFSPYKYNYEILSKDIDMSKFTATKRYAGAAVDQKSDGNSVSFTVTNPATVGSKTYTVSIKELPNVSDRLTRVGISDVELNDGYWKDTITQYMTWSLDYIYDMFDYSCSFDNFDRLARGERKVSNNTSEHAGQILIPSDDNRLIGDKDGRWNWGEEPWREALIYGVIRAASDFIAIYADDARLGDKARDLKDRTEGYIDRIVAAGLTCTGSDRNGKCIDGYFDTYVLLTKTAVLDEAEVGHIWNHDLYSFGGLVEAGISWYRATGDTRLLFLATRFAEFLVDYMYGQDGYLVVPSHQIAEEPLIALYDMYKTDPELVNKLKSTYDRYSELSSSDRYYNFDIRYEKYIDIVKDWIEKRGVYEGRYNNISYGDYAQDHATYDKQTTAAGHAVRANLWYSAIAAAGNYLDNDKYLSAANTIWNDITEHQMYITGGTGSTHAGEAYGGDDFLPHDGYCETCASVGMGFFALNMSDIFGDAKYADVLELELYNGILGCLGTDGQSFYYQNPLTADNYQRPFWSGATPCCPPMYMKFFAILPTYIYSYNTDKLVVNQYISSSANITVGETAVEINQYTDLPDGNVAVFDVKADGEFDLLLRAPSWAKSVSLKVGGNAVDAAVNADGYVRISRTWSGTTRVEIVFDKQVERIYQDNAAANKGQVAFRYGPMLYCAESDDNTVDGVDLTQSFPVVSRDAKLSVKFVPDMFTYKTGEGGKDTFRRDVNVLEAEATVSGEKRTLTLIPYYLRDNRTHSSMRVWFWESSRTVGGMEVQPFDDESALADFELYDETRFAYADGVLKTDARAEAKAIYKPRKDLTDFTVSADFRQASTYMNGGLYILAGNASAEQDKIDALNVQIEHEVNADKYKVSLFKFSAASGYLGSLAQSRELRWTDTVNLEVTVNGGIVSVSANGEECLRYALQTSDPKSGSVGIRSMQCAVYVDNFAVMCEDIPLHKDALESAVAAAESIDLSGYKQNGVQAVRDALQQAKSVLASAVSDAEINRARSALDAAVAALEAKSDMTALESAIAEAEKIELSAYTEETVAAFADALEKAKALSADDSQADIDAAVSALEAAKNGLRAKPNESADSASAESGGLSGGAVAGIAVASAVLGAAAGVGGCALYASRKKKKGDKESSDEQEKDDRSE